MPSRRLNTVQTNAQMRASASAILEECNISEPPINVYQILRAKNVPVDFIPFSSSKVEGIYLKNATGVGIAINQNHHPVKQRFTGAHELKHHCHDVTEHGKMLCSAAFNRRDIEQRANRFAAELLVPVNQFQQVIEELLRSELLTVTTLAQTFHVSYPTIVFRLHTLGYITSRQRDGLLTPEERQADEHTALSHVGSRNAAKLRLPAIITLLGSQDGFSYCPHCSKLVFDPVWTICHSCGKSLDGPEPW